MGLDIRWPIGLMFSLIGVLLTGYGVFNRVAAVTQVQGQEVNIDLIWGVVLLVFGVAMLFGRSAAGRIRPRNKREDRRWRMADGKPLLFHLPSSIHHLRFNLL